MGYPSTSGNGRIKIRYLPEHYQEKIIEEISGAGYKLSPTGYSKQPKWCRLVMSMLSYVFDSVSYYPPNSEHNHEDKYVLAFSGDYPDARPDKVFELLTRCLPSGWVEIVDDPAPDAAEKGESSTEDAGTDKMDELDFIQEFVNSIGGIDTKAEKRQLRALWTALCFHRDWEVDTMEYDNAIRDLWELMKETESKGWCCFETFGQYMCKYLV